MHKSTTKIATLEQLPPDQVGRVTALTCTGAERRRMMDLGILPGTQIEVEMTNPLGDPTAYQIRGAIIALRSEQARQIQIVVDGAVQNDAAPYQLTQNQSAQQKEIAR